MPNNEENKKLFGKISGDKYFRIGLTAFLVVASCLILGYLLLHLTNIIGFLGKVANILQPIIIGLVISYLINPLYVAIRRLFVMLFEKIGRPVSKGLLSFTKGVSIFVSLALLILLVVFLFYMVIPQLYVSISGLVSVLPAEFDKLMALINGMGEKEGPLYEVLTSVINFVSDWVKNDLPGLLNVWATKFASGVISTVGVITNLVIGVIVAVYVLNRKELFLAQSKKLTCTLFSEKNTGYIFSTVRTVHEVLSRFINGKLVEALIVGVICFIGVWALRIPYPLLVSAVICITDIIPVFGPYIGGIPCTVLIAISDPIKAVYFVIFLVLLQTFDGNIIGPRIIGDSTGLNPFWAMFSIIFAGGLFGIPGMLLGAPLFSVIYSLLKMRAEEELKKKGLPTDTEEYLLTDTYGISKLKIKQKKAKESAKKA